MPAKNSDFSSLTKNGFPLSPNASILLMLKSLTDYNYTLKNFEASCSLVTYIKNANNLHSLNPSKSTGIKLSQNQNQNSVNNNKNI